MQNVDWGILKSAAAQYEVRIVRVQSIAPGRFLVSTPDMSYEARILAAASAEWRQVVGDALAQHGFRFTQRLLRTMYGDRWVPLSEDKVFCLVPVGDGEPLQVQPEDVQVAATNLALLHQSLDTAYGENSSLVPPRVRYGTWFRNLDQGMHWIAAERLLVESRAERDDDKRRANWLKAWEELAQVALEVLEPADGPISQTARDKSDIAWGDYRLSHLRQRGKVVMTLQTVDPVGDTQLLDLATLCQEVLSVGHADGAVDVISGYVEARPLSTEQINWVKGFSAFPHHVLHQLRKRRTTGTTDSEPRLWQDDTDVHYMAAKRFLGLA